MCKLCVDVRTLGNLLLIMYEKAYSYKLVLL